MKKIKLFALAAFAMLSTNAMAYYVGDDQVGKAFIVNGIEYQVTSKYVPGDGALTPETIGQVTVIRYANSTLTTAVSIPSQVQSLDVEGDIDPDYKYSVVGIDGAENGAGSAVELGEGGVYKVNTTTAHKPFANCAATSVTLPTSVMYIGKGAFEGFKGSAVVIPLGSTLSVIGDGAFFKATALETFATTNATILSKIGVNAFYGCAKLAAFTVGEKLTEIGAGAFIGTAITSLDFSTCKNFWKEEGTPTINRLFTAAAGLTAYDGDAVDAAYAEADYTNAKLQSIVLPATLATGATAFEIAANAFEGCTALATIGSTANTAAIPAIVTAIGAGAFKNTNITKFDISANATITTIGDWFSKYVSPTDNKSKLTQVILNKTKGYTIGTNLAGISTLEKVGTADGEYQLSAGTALVAGMFAGTKLAQLDLSKITTVADLPALFGAAGISSLTSITLNNGTTSLAANAFAKCVALETLAVKQADGTAKDLKAITAVGDGAFYRTKLASLTFGAALKSFEKPWGVFVEADGAMSLATAITLDLSASTSLNNPEAAAVAVAYEEGDAKTAVQIATALGAVFGNEVGNWKEQEAAGTYKKIASIVEEVITYEEGDAQTAVEIATALGATFGDAVGNWKAQGGDPETYKQVKTAAVDAVAAQPVQIVAGAFAKLAALTSIKLPTTLVLIGENAFEGTGFTSLELPNTISQFCADPAAAAGIGALAFKDSKLAELKFYPAVNTGTIFGNDNVFSGCSMVKIYTTKTYADKVGDAPTFSQWVTSSPEEVTTVKDKVKNQAMKGFISNQPYAFDASECQVYEAYFDGEDIVMSPLRKIGGKYNVPGTTAVVVRTENATTITPDLITDWDDAMSSMVYGRLGLHQLRSVLEETSRADVYQNYMYVLVNNATAGFSFQHYTGSKIKKGNIYVINPDKAPGARLNIVWLDENGNVEEDATAIKAIEAAEAENGAIYNLQGVRVNAAKKGLYIKNGKKYIMK